MDEAFFTDITNYLTVEVFPIILESLRTKGFNLTADDLLDIINEPITSDTSNHCIYQFRRGGNKGLFCNKPVAPGNNYCSNCIKTDKKPRSRRFSHKFRTYHYQIGTIKCRNS